MTLHVLHAGDGYSYLTRQVATADRQRERGQELTDYYTATGTPAGRWHGAGLAGLSAVSEVSGEVTEAQMKALFGEGRHPNTDEMLADGARLKDTALGRKFPEFANENAFVNAVNRAAEEAMMSLDRPLTTEERHGIEGQVAPAHFEADKGRVAESDRELAAWMARQRNSSRQPVAGYDCVFTPQKSVSVLWGLADHDTRQAIERIHRECVDDALGWMESESAYTRRGDRSEIQIDSSGLIVAQFEHFDTRAGDPNFHTHCAISNKVLGCDGRWSALDGATLHRHTVAASQRYNTSIVDRMRRELGVQFEARHPRPGRPPVWEVAGIDQGLAGAFSSRRAAIEARYGELIDEYRHKHGRSPNRSAHYRLLQQATLDTREGKAEPRSLAELRDGWRQTAERHLGSSMAVEEMLDRALHPEPAEATIRELGSIESESSTALTTVSDARAEWKRAHVINVVEAQVADVAFDSAEHKQRAVDAITETVLTGSSVEISTPETIAAPLPKSLTRSGHESVFERHGEQSFTSEEMLRLERELLGAAHTTVPMFTSTAEVDSAAERQAKASGHALNAGQLELARHFCQSGAVVAAGVGPAGTGKTTAMATVADAWTSSGGRVIALAPSAVAAENLREEIGQDAYTIAAFTYRWRGKMEHMGYEPRAPEGLPTRISSADMLLVDEAAMASTKDLHALYEIAEEAGAVVRLVGDPAQLDSVETGGMMRQLASDTYAPTLNEIVRFGSDHEQSAASQAVRAGDVTALAFYRDRGFIHGGDKQPLVQDAVEAYLADTAAGRDTVLLASTVDTVGDLNSLVQADHLAAGRVSHAHTADLADGLTGGRGDIIVTRSNNGGLRTKGGTRPGSRVNNGDRWEVTRVHKDGQLTVRHLGHHGRLSLPAAYVWQSTELGYASTIHRAQGITVDVSRTIVDDGTDRRGLYVALTRGRAENHSYVVDTPLEVDTERMHVVDEGDGAELPPEDPEKQAQVALAAVLERDEGHTTATQAVRDALAAADDPDRMADRYNAARSRLVGDYSQHLLTDLPVAVTAELRNDPQLAAHWRATCKRHLAAGHDLADAIDTVRNAIIDELTGQPDLPDTLPEATRQAIEQDPQALALVQAAARAYTAEGLDYPDAIEAAVDDLMDGSLHRATDKLLFDAAETEQTDEPALPENTRPTTEQEPDAIALAQAAVREHIADGLDHTDAIEAAIDDLDLDATESPTETDRSAHAAPSTGPDLIDAIDHKLGDTPDRDGALAPLPPRHPGMDTELADYAAAARTEHARLVDEAHTDDLTPAAPVELHPAPDLDGGRLTDTDLSHTDFRGRDLTDVSFMRCDLTGARFDEATLDATMFARCTLDDASFAGATSQRGVSITSRSTMTGVDLTDLHAQRLTLRGVTGQDINAHGASFGKLIVTDSQLGFAREGTLTNSNRTKVDAESTVTGFAALADRAGTSAGSRHALESDDAPGSVAPTGAGPTLGSPSVDVDRGPDLD